MNRENNFMNAAGRLNPNGIPAQSPVLRGMSLYRKGGQLWVA